MLRVQTILPVQTALNIRKGKISGIHSSCASSRKQVINQHQRQIDAGSHQHPARFQIPRLSKKNRQHRKTAYRDIHIRKNAARFRPFPRPAWNMFPPWKRNGNAGSTA